MYRISLLVLLLTMPSFAVTESELTKQRQLLESAAAKFESPLEFAFDFSYSPRKYERYVYANAVTSTEAGYGGDVTFEWIPMTQYGKIGIGVGAGFSVHQNVVIVDADEDEVATLYTLPLSVHLSYRADFVRNQILVPYGKVGPSMTFIKQNSGWGYSRDGIQQFVGLNFGGGIELNLNPLEPGSARALDRSTGINASYLFAEYDVISALGNATYNLARNEWRFGLRFEF
jgi:hypothetical protein